MDSRLTWKPKLETKLPTDSKQTDNNTGAGVRNTAQRSVAAVHQMIFAFFDLAKRNEIKAN